MPPSKANDNIEMIEKLFGLDKREIRLLVKEGVIPKPVNGKYNIALCVPDYIAYLKRIIHRRIYMTKVEYAEHRSVSQAAVSMAIKRDKLSGAIVNIDGVEKIDRDIADQLWGDGISTVEDKDTNLYSRPLEELVQSHPQIARIKARAIREASLALQEVMNEKERRGELEPRQRVYREMFTIFRILRDNLQALALRFSVEMPNDIKGRKKLADEAFEDLLKSMPEKYEKLRKELPQSLITEIEQMEAI